MSRNYVVSSSVTIALVLAEVVGVSHLQCIKYATITDRCCCTDRLLAGHVVSGDTCSFRSPLQNATGKIATRTKRHKQVNRGVED